MCPETVVPKHCTYNSLLGSDKRPEVQTVTTSALKFLGKGPSLTFQQGSSCDTGITQLDVDLTPGPHFQSVYYWPVRLCLLAQDIFGPMYPTVLAKKQACVNWRDKAAFLPPWSTILLLSFWGSALLDWLSPCRCKLQSLSDVLVECKLLTQ